MCANSATVCWVFSFYFVIETPSYINEIIYFSDMETPFLSFANPNYEFDTTTTNNNYIAASDLNSPADVNVNILSMASEKQEKVKLQIGELNGSQNSLDDDNLSLKSDELSSDEENDFVDSESKLLGENDADEKLDNCVTSEYGDNKTPKGILAYISLLEQSARDRKNEKKKEKNIIDDYQDDCDSGQVTPMLNENIKDKM